MKTRTMEELLTWAYVDELPKGGGVDGLENANSAWRMLEASSWGKIAQVELLGQTIDEGGRRDNYFIEQGEPHEDALAIGAAVAQLGHCDVMLPVGWNPVADWPGEGEAARLAGEAVARAVQRFNLRTPARRGASIVSLVVGTAILGRAPDWSAEEPKVRMVERGGKPAWFETKRVSDGIGGAHVIETDGYNGRTHRPVKGAYRKYEFSIDPVGDILSRLDWQVWVAALRWLRGQMAEQMIAHRVEQVDRSMTPWLAEDRGGVIIVGGDLGKPATKKPRAAC